jgi:hypothetical protein
MDDHHRGMHLAAKNAESCGYLLSKLTGDSEISGRAHPSASGQVYYQELVMGEDQTENPQIFQDGQQTISTEEIQDNIYEPNGCIPLDYKVIAHSILTYHFHVLLKCCPCLFKKIVAHAP